MKSRYKKTIKRIVEDIFIYHYQLEGQTVMIFRIMINEMSIQVAYTDRNGKLEYGDDGVIINSLFKNGLLKRIRKMVKFYDGKRKI